MKVLSAKPSQSGPSVEVFDRLAFVSDGAGSAIGFHIENLQVAQLSPEIQSLIHKSGPNFFENENQADEEAIEELKTWNGSTNPDLKPGTLHFGPRSITINVTQVCNLHCTYCAAGGDGTFGDPVKKIAVDKTLPQLKSFLERVPAGRKFHITFLGGEPLLYPEGIRILASYASEQAQARNIQISYTVVTNGTLFSEAVIQTLVDIKASLIISVDGPPEINDRTRPGAAGKGRSEQMIEGTKRLLMRKAELGTIEMSGVFGAQNMELKKAYEFYQQFDLDYMDFTYDHLEKRAEVSENFTRSLLEVAAVAYKQAGETGLRKIKTFDRFFELLDKQQQVQNYCGAGKSFFMIDARNQIYTCPWVAGDKSEVVGIGSDIWLDKLKAYQPSLVELNGCGSCWARNLCGGGCMYIHKNQTGSKNKVDDNFCKRTKLLIAQALLYYVKGRSGEGLAERTAL